jgi:hypothetical protein
MLSNFWLCDKVHICRLLSAVNEYQGLWYAGSNRERVFEMCLIGWSNASYSFSVERLNGIVSDVWSGIGPWTHYLRPKSLTCYTIELTSPIIAYRGGVLGSNRVPASLPYYSKSYLSFSFVSVYPCGWQNAFKKETVLRCGYCGMCRWFVCRRTLQCFQLQGTLTSSANSYHLHKLWGQHAVDNECAAIRI